jgi:adenosine deaminase CECR1
MSSEEIEVDDNLQWELSEGIPQKTDPFIQQYFKGRDALVTQEEKHRSGE